VLLYRGCGDLCRAISCGCGREDPENREGGEEEGEEKVQEEEDENPGNIDKKSHESEKDEDTVYGPQRAKLFRFDSEKKEWKERGTGDVKFLKNRNSGKIRLLMRREKILKVCANQWILPHIKLQVNAGSDRSWVWSAFNGSEDTPTPQMELLAIRFADSDIALKFKNAYEAAQKEVPATTSESSAPPKEPEVPEETTTSEEKKPESTTAATTTPSSPQK